MLRQAQLRLRDSGRRVVYVDASAIDSAASLASRLRAGLTGSYGPPIEQFAALPDVGRGAPALPGGASRSLNTQLDAINEAEQATVLLDASDSGTAVRELFGRFRDTLWQGAHTWVVAVDEAERASVLRPPTDAFFDVMLLIHPWDPDPLLRLLALRTSELDRATLGEIAADARGNPRDALRGLADVLVEGGTPGGLLRRGAALQRKAARLVGRPEQLLLRELLDRGQASASDEDLQRSLGLSRARLSQLLTNLLEHDLVEADTLRTEGPGRPKTVYRPRLEDDPADEGSPA
jgi:hypothetical protein